MYEKRKYGTYGYTHLNLGEKKPDCCGTCKYHKKEDDWVCDNPDSDCYTDYTEYRDFCENFEKRTR